MRILVIHTVYKLNGGEDSVVANEIELLRSSGYVVELLQFNNSGSTVAKLAQLPFNFSSYSTAKKKIAAFKPDVAHIHNLHFAGSASVIYALKKYRIPTVLTLHNYRLLCPSATLFHRGQMFTSSINKEFNWDAVAKGVYQNSKLITFWVSLSMWLHQKLGTWKYPAVYIALGEFTKDIFLDSKLRAIAGRIVVKPNFCYPNATISNIAPKGSYLYIGRLSEEKGIKLLLTAFSENKLPLVIAGTGPLADEVRMAAGQNSNLTFLGPVGKSQVNELLAGARALVFPSLWYETFGMVLIEAFASGTPVIASDLGQLTYTVRHQVNGLRFKTGDVADLKEKISYIHGLGEKAYAAYRENARQTYRQDYSPEKNRSLLNALYRRAAGGS